MTTKSRRFASLSGLAVAAAVAAAPLPSRTLAQGTAPSAKEPVAPAQSVALKAPPVLSVADAEALSKSRPKDTNSWLALGGAYRRAHRYPEALTAFRKMATLDPANSTAHVSLGAVYMDMNRTKDAEVEFRKAVTINPKDAAAHYNLGTFYQSQGRRDDALGEFKKATALEPPISSAWVNLGLIQAEIGQTNDAVNSYKKAIAIDSTNVRALCNLGNSYYGMGRIPDATALYKKALQLEPKNQEALYNMGVAFADAQIYKAAIEYWRRVTAIDSTSQVADAARSSIQVLQQYLDQQKNATPTGSTPGH